MEVTGRIAAIAFREQGHLGASFHNVFTCVEENGVWAVAAKTFTTL